MQAELAREEEEDGGEMWNVGAWMGGGGGGEKQTKWKKKKMKKKRTGRGRRGLDTE